MDAGTRAAAPLGRRERKRLETRRALIDAAMELFEERDFESVTVAAIAQRADVDTSTFFRHFGSKEAVLFTDWAVFTEAVGPALRSRPPGEPLLSSIVGVLADLGEQWVPDPVRDVLRARLAEASPVLQAQALVHRERLARELAAAIAERLGTDHERDPLPYIAAGIWASALDFHRRRALLDWSPDRSDDALAPLFAELLDTIRRFWPDGLGGD